MLPDLQPWGPEWDADPAAPAGRNHPLNRGRLAWWLALPHTAGVREWYDLFGVRSLTLANYQAAGAPYWQGTARPGGRLELGLKNSANAYATAAWGTGGPGAAVVGAGQPRTAAFWARPSAAGVAAGWMGTGNSPADTSPLWLIQQQAGNVWAVYANAGYRVGTAPITAGGWYHLCYTFDGTTHTLYVNGRQDAQAVTGDSAFDNASLYVGSSYPGSATGAIDDVGYWTRALSASEAWALYDLSRLGYPGLLRRVTPPPGPAPPAADAPWLAGRALSPAAPPGPAPAGLGGWSPRLAAPAPDPLAWLLRRATPPALEGHTPALPEAGWRPAIASEPLPALVPWLAGPALTPEPPARPPAQAISGWRPDIAAGPAPPVRHALVRFWRGPEARMPRLEEGEPAWATDTKSLWMGSASGNVRVGP